jgi:hypothetical protein
MPYIQGAETIVPTVKNFGSYRITLFAEDHYPPHVHVIAAISRPKSVSAMRTFSPE